MKKFVLDEIDHQILDVLIENARTPFTDIAKKLLVSAGTIHVRVKKMEDENIIQGSTLTLNYEKMGYSFIAHVGVFLEKTSLTQSVIDALRTIPNITDEHAKVTILAKNHSIMNFPNKIVAASTNSNN